MDFDNSIIQTYYMMVKDPLGNNIYFPQHLCCNQNACCEGVDIFDNVQDVIQKPALLLRGKKHQMIHYYFRLVGIDRSVLIKVQKADPVWEALECVTNPDNNYLLQLMSESEVIKSY